MPSTRRWWPLLAIAAAIAIAAGILVRQVGTQGASPREATQALAKAAFRDLKGAPVSLADWKGQVVVLNFWATWCPPCREEMPALMRYQQRYAPNGIQVVGIALDEPDKVRAFGEELKVNYPLLLGGTELFKLMTQLGNRAGALPFTVIVDRQGNFAAAHLGALTEAQLEKLVAAKVPS
ncbi:MAG: TlpA family protein disulfide reductase [Burkholderiales bacterium]|jgi:thiol-disulfide isomerase/thioredoxin|nr:TlpA family protein disulfide reductase [Burkholderiales bacterium]